MTRVTRCKGARRASTFNHCIERELGQVKFIMEEFHSAAPAQIPSFVQWLQISALCSSLYLVTPDSSNPSPAGSTAPLAWLNRCWKFGSGGAHNYVRNESCSLILSHLAAAVLQTDLPMKSSAQHLIVLEPPGYQGMNNDNGHFANPLRVPS